MSMWRLGESAPRLRRMFSKTARYSRARSTTFAVAFAIGAICLIAGTTLTAVDYNGDGRPDLVIPIYEGVLETVREGTSTSDLGGHASTTEFTDAVIAKIKSKLDVWATL